MHEKYWTNREISILEDYYLNEPIDTFTVSEISATLGRSVNAVKLRAGRLGLKKRRDEKNKDIRQCTGCGRILPISNFGFMPWRGRPYSKCKACRGEVSKRESERRKRNRLNRRSNPELHEHDLEKQKEYKIANINRIMWLQSRKRAKEKNISFNITPKDIVVPEYCPLLGIELKFNGNMNNRDSSPSIDRINPCLGYVRGNIMVISYRANRIKNDATLEELQTIVRNMEEMQVKSKEEKTVIIIRQ